MAKVERCGCGHGVGYHDDAQHGICLAFLPTGEDCLCTEYVSAEMLTTIGEVLDG